jgi:peptide-methionine (S)-S-oxide reductase
MGGAVDNPTYEQVCSGRSGHVEVVQVDFDPNVTSFDEVLEVFFAIHDPTTPNRQGNDIGPQYRSVIFYHTEEQRTAAKLKIAELDASGAWPDPIVTSVEASSRFWKAEAYHDDYYRNNSRQP